MSRFLEATLALSLVATPAAADRLGLGRPALTEEIAAWDIDVRPDGQGLPEGRGDVMTGEGLYIDNCAVCHGDFGEAVGRWPVLAGGQGTLNHEDPNKTIGSYWPYLSTVYDYVHRAMPFGNAQSLSDDDVYAITAYLLYLNDLVEDDFELSRENFAEVRLPNEENFFMDDRDEVELPAFTREPCMENCKETVEITARAAVIDVTPEDTAARERRAAAPTAEPAAEVAAATPEPAVPAVSPEQVAAGEKAFRACQACHKVGEGAKNGTGPALNGVVGHAAGKAEGFKYSKAMAEKVETGLVWTPEALDAFLADPRGFMKGTRMAYGGMKDADQRAAVIAYLSTFAED
ncbi:c-type cytochrome [Limibaculum sp. FT325]|uniref:c-type cytochrome n=1 Tax=Thermohalobaculum sediminis TaxID=2939436 RepID=UPI0020BDEEDC|nr:c-type cytochrome [Limibaculum sediminis]MCL5778664.1 c-type cytochrome [Limibaculum sediminis]